MPPRVLPNKREIDFWSQCEGAFGTKTGSIADGHHDDGRLALEPAWVALRIYNQSQLDLVTQTIFTRLRCYVSWQLNAARHDSAEDFCRLKSPRCTAMGQDLLHSRVFALP